ncbi:MAG: SWIB/MDM2 domain-containing protein, partial [Cyclobacteriaceae bacterium]|nr:SWIB/MDM2 domain-containing protein [Cyclobacteriaceae bacterium]
MARTVKSTKTTESTTTESVSNVPVVDTEVKVAPVAKKTRAPKQVAATPAPVPVPVEVSAPVTVSAPVVVSDEVVVDGETPLSEQSIAFFAKLQQFGALISSLKTEYRTLEKKWTRELKAAQKQSSRRKRKSGNRAPSGFVKPTRISDELALFLGKEKGTEMARTAVTRDINAYIRTNKLQNAENGRKINPDAKLTALLKLKKTDELTYFNLQRYMSPHFFNAAKAKTDAA